MAYFAVYNVIFHRMQSNWPCDMRHTIVWTAPVWKIAVHVAVWPHFTISRINNYQ